MRATSFSRRSAARVPADAHHARALRRLLVGHGADRRHAARRPGLGLGHARPLRLSLPIANPNVGTLDWIIDPYAREFGVGKMSAFTLGYQPYVWSAAEAHWRTPALPDLVLYEINIAEFGGDLERTRNVMAYLADLGVNAIEVMPLSNVAASVDWGYLPIGYFGVDERFGKRSDFQAAGRSLPPARHRGDRRCGLRPHRRGFSVLRRLHAASV